MACVRRTRQRSWRTRSRPAKPGLPSKYATVRPDFRSRWWAKAARAPSCAWCEETLQIRSPGTAQRYLGAGAEPLRGADGFVDTGDRVEARAGRYYFMGRRGGVINVGGLKVHPEEVETVINAHPWVRMSLVKARRNPITGAVVTADVVLKDEAPGRPAPETVMRELTECCRRTLPSHKVPAMIRFVPSLEVSPSGKLVRPSA